MHRLPCPHLNPLAPSPPDRTSRDTFAQNASQQIPLTNSVAIVDAQCRNSTFPRLMACPIDPPFVHNVWSLDFKYARYAKKLGDCAGTYGSAAPRWVSSGSVNSEPKPVRLVLARTIASLRLLFTTISI